MASLLRRTIVLGLAVLVMATMGCSKKDKKTNPVVPSLTQENADDLVQQAAMMIATDQGGWLIDVQSALESTPMEAPPAPLARRLDLVPASASPIVRTLRDSSFTRAGMNYTFSMSYADTVDSTLWHPGVTTIDAVVHATGTLNSTGFTGFYKHDGDPVTLEWFEVGADTVVCSGVGDDSLFTTFTPTFRTGTRYFNSTSFVDFDFKMRRDPVAHPFPLAGEANAFMFADELRTPNPSDYTNTLEGTVTFVFDGTQTPLVGVTNEFESTDFQYRYRVDLRTGAMTRQP